MELFTLNLLEQVIVSISNNSTPHATPVNFPQTEAGDRQVYVLHTVSSYLPSTGKPPLHIPYSM